MSQALSTPRHGLRITDDRESVNRLSIGIQGKSRAKNPQKPGQKAEKTVHRFVANTVMQTVYEECHGAIKNEIPVIPNIYVFLYIKPVLSDSSKPDQSSGDLSN